MEATAGPPALPQQGIHRQKWLQGPLSRGGAQSCGRSKKPPGTCASLSRGQHSLPAETRLPSDHETATSDCPTWALPNAAEPLEPLDAVVQRPLRAGRLLQPPALPREREGSMARGRAGSLSLRGTGAPGGTDCPLGLDRCGRCVAAQQLCILLGNGTQPCCRVRTEGPALRKGAWSKDLQRSLPS